MSMIYNFSDHYEIINVNVIIQDFELSNDFKQNICIYCHHRQTVSVYHNSSVWLNAKDTWSWDWNPPNFTLDLVS